MITYDIEIGQKITNAELAETFDCSGVGNMRLSKESDTLILISDFTKGLSHDKWIDGVLHFTGYGKTGDQDIHKGQNATLCDSRRYEIDIHLFELLYPGEFTYCGRVELDANPYPEMQPGEDRKERMSWVFPLKPLTNEHFEKPLQFVFKDSEDYKANGAKAEQDYVKVQDTLKKVKPTAKAAAPAKPLYQPIKKEVIEIPTDIVGKCIKHKKYGEGTVTAVEGKMIVVTFADQGEKKLGYEVCIKNKLIEVLS